MPLISLCMDSGAAKNGGDIKAATLLQQFNPQTTCCGTGIFVTAEMPDNVASALTKSVDVYNGQHPASKMVLAR